MDTKKIETVLTTVTIDSKVDSGKIDVVVGESAKMDVVKAVNYIQSGKAEIEAGVTEVFNQVDNHVAEKTAEFDQNASDKTDAFNQNAQDKTDAFDDNASDKTGDFNTNATAKTTDFNDNYFAKKALIDAEVQNAETAAETATAQAEIATDKASEALSSANAAESMATSASSSARSASNSASQAGVSASNASASELNAKASETAAAGSASSALSSASSASSSASSASSSASSASSSATNASNYADLSKQWAVGDPSEPSEGSAKYWAEQASRTLPNDGQLDIQVNGSSIATFTANQSGNTTANIVVPDSATWGNITGTLSNQTDLQTALNAKANKDNTINGAPISNTSQYYFGISTTAAATVQKEVTIAGITELNAGQVIIVRPTVTSSVANSTLKLNNFNAYPMRYNNAAITTSTDSVVWSANYPTIWLFDGNYWVFAGHGIDSNTTYSVMSVAEGVAGTATSSRVLRSDYLKKIIETLAPAEVIDQTYSATSTNAQSGTAVAEAISTKYDTSNPAGYITGISSSDVTTALGYTPYNSSNPAGFITSSDLTPYALRSSLATVATTGAYSDLSGTPTIPTVNNPTITITQGGTTKGSFTLNQSTNASIDLDSGGTTTITYDATTETLTWS